MLDAAIVLSVLVGLLYTNLTGLLTGGLISGGYIALFGLEPARVAATLLFSVLIWLLMRALSNHMILYGRRRFALTVALSFVLYYLVERFILPHAGLPFDIRVVGRIIPGLIANDMLRQGCVRTLLSVLIVAGVVWLLLALGTALGLA